VTTTAATNRPRPVRSRCRLVPGQGSTPRIAALARIEDHSERPALTHRRQPRRGCLRVRTGNAALGNRHLRSHIWQNIRSRVVPRTVSKDPSSKVTVRCRRSRITVRDRSHVSCGRISSGYRGLSTFSVAYHRTTLASAVDTREVHGLGSTPGR